jgi:PAS domain S-box-containing protein
MADGKVTRISGAFQDIDEQKRADDALKQQEAMLSAIFRAAPVGIGLVKERVIHQVNETLCRMTGYTTDELLGRSSRILYPSEEDFRYVGEEKYRQLREEGKGTVKTRWRTKEGRIIDVLLSSAPLNPGDTSEGVTFTALEIDHRQRAEAVPPKER